MNTEIKNKLVALEANVDAVLFRRMYEDEEQQQPGMGMGVGRALNIGVGAAAIGAGAYGAKIGDQAIRRKYGMMPGVGRREAYRRAGMDAMDAVKGYGSRAQDAVAGSEGYKAGAKAWQRSSGKGAGLFSRVRRVLGGATRAMTGGRFGFEEIEGRVNRLSAQIEMSSLPPRADARKLNDYKALYLKNQNAEKAAKAGKKAAAKITPEFQRAVFRAVFGKSRL
jgi:hypothetical protein